MASGVEVRVPFLDHELVLFANSLPDKYKQRGLTSKWILKKAMENTLPKDIIYRPKTGFGAPIRRWMRHELRPLLAEYLSEKNIVNRGLFNPNKIQELITKNDLGLVDGSYTLFSLLCIEIWCRQFIDNSNKLYESKKEFL